MTKIICCGSNRLNQLPTNDGANDLKDGFQIISKPQEYNFKEDIISFSTYHLHSLYVNKVGQVYQLGSTDPEVCFQIPVQERELNERKEIQIIDKEKMIHEVLSVVCGYCYSLFLLQDTKSQEDDTKAINLLAYYYNTQGCKIDQNDNPVFYEAENVSPTALYGGWRISAAMDKNDQILVFIPSKSPTKIPLIISFPLNYIENKDYPLSIACLDNSLIILTTKNNVVEYKLDQNEDEEAFQPINLGITEKIIQISGTYKHCFLVTENHVYGRGNNNCGQLGLGKITNENKNVEDFREIKELENKNIVAAYAGFNHSIFQTKGGEIYVCGSNSHGQLFLNDMNIKYLDTPQKVPNINKVIFCTAGDCSSVALSKGEDRNWPNKNYEKILFHPPRRKKKVENDDNEAEDEPKSTPKPKPKPNNKVTKPKKSKSTPKASKK